MATKTLNARLKLKYDTIENWQTSDMVLLSGEAAVAVRQNGAVTIKIGDGSSTYNELPENLFAHANDVYPWAKSYQLEWSDPNGMTFEGNTHVLSGLSAYIEDHSTSTMYTQSAIDETGEIGLQFQHKEPKDASWTNDESITISEGNTNGTIHIALSSLEKDIPVHGLGTAAYTDIGDLFRSRYTIVDELPTPTSGTMDMIYLLASETPSGDDRYVSYITLSADDSGVISYNWEKIGDSTITVANLSGDATVDPDLGNGSFYALTSVMQSNGKISMGGEVKLAAIAKSVTSNTTITDENFILDCGNATIS